MEKIKADEHFLFEGYAMLYGQWLKHSLWSWVDRVIHNDHNWVISPKFVHMVTWSGSVHYNNQKDAF